MAENISKGLATDNYENVSLTLTLYLLKCHVEILVILTPTLRKTTTSFCALSYLINIL